MEPETDDYGLARRACDGDPEALDELVERSRLRLFTIAYGILRSYEDAQDAVASALCQICLHIGELREPERIAAWMDRIARNEAHILLRRRRPAMPLDERDAPVDSRAAWELRLDVERALMRLPREQARAVALHYLGGLPIHAIARRLGRPEGSIKRWLHLGRRRLAQEMEEYAPMQTLPAAIISTELEPHTLARLSDALGDAGFAPVHQLQAVPVPDRSDAGSNVEFHLAGPLARCCFVLLDEWIGGRSAFELQWLLKAAAEGQRALIGMLAASPSEGTLTAGWLSGFDLLLSKPVDPAELSRLARRLRDSLGGASGADAAGGGERAGG